MRNTQTRSYHSDRYLHTVVACMTSKAPWHDRRESLVPLGHYNHYSIPSCRTLSSVWDLPSIRTRIQAVGKRSKAPSAFEAGDLSSASFELLYAPAVVLKLVRCSVGRNARLLLCCLGVVALRWRHLSAPVAPKYTWGSSAITGIQRSVCKAYVPTFRNQKW